MTGKKTISWVHVFPGSAETLVRIGWDNKSPLDSILCRHLCQK